MLGSKLGILVGLKLRTGGGFATRRWVSPSSLMVSGLQRLTLLRGYPMVCSPMTPARLWRMGSAGRGGRGGGGSLGGLGVMGPLLVDLLVLLSLSWLSNALLPIWDLISSILHCVFLVLMRASRVSLDLSLRFALLLTSWSSRSCFINRLRKNVNSLRRGSGLCAITRYPGVFP